MVHLQLKKKRTYKHITLENISRLVYINQYRYHHSFQMKQHTHTHSMFTALKAHTFLTLIIHMNAHYDVLALSTNVYCQFIRTKDCDMCMQFAIEKSK